MRQTLPHHGVHQTALNRRKMTKLDAFKLNYMPTSIIYTVHPATSLYKMSLTIVHFMFSLSLRPLNSK